MSFLIDTNVISELTKKQPNKNVIKFIKEASPADQYISVLTIGEIKKRIEKLPDGIKKNDINEWMDNFVLKTFSDRIIPIDLKIAYEWGKVCTKHPNIKAIDSLLAATAISFKLAIVTRNIKDFTEIKNEIKILNPWEY